MMATQVTTRSYYCREYGKKQPLAQHVEERQLTHDYSGDEVIIYWDFKVLECGHEVEDWSH